MSSFRSRLLQQNAMIPKEYIQFADPEVERVCIENWSSDGIGLTVEDAEKITSLGNVFQGNGNIQTFDELNLFPNLKVIGTKCFSECTNLSSINLQNIEEINARAFYNCMNLQIELSLPNLKKITAGFYKSGITKILDLGKCTELNSEGGSGIGSFLQCTNLTAAYIDNVELIGASCFNGCTQLSHVNMMSVRKILGMAFLNCNNLSGELNLPLLESLLCIFNNTKISKVINLGTIQTLKQEDGSGNGTFIKNAELTSITLPSTLTTIEGWNAFDGCPITKLIVNAVTPPSIMGNVELNNQNINIYVPDESVEAYKTATGWIDYADKIRPISEYVEQ